MDEGAEVNDDCESPLELVDDPIELTRGDEVPEEYANGGCGNGNDGSLSVTYGRRW